MIDLKAVNFRLVKTPSRVSFFFNLFIYLFFWVWIFSLFKVRSETANQSSRGRLPLKQRLLMMTSVDQTQAEKQFFSAEKVSYSIKSLFLGVNGFALKDAIWVWAALDFSTTASLIGSAPLAGISNNFRSDFFFFFNNSRPNTLSAWVSLNDCSTLMKWIQLLTSSEDSH